MSRIETILSVRRLHPAFATDERGGVLLLVSLLIVPILFMGGFAVDYTRAMSIRHQLQQAADAAALAARGSGENAEQAAQAAADAFARANVKKLNGAVLGPVKVTPTASGVRVELSAVMPTSISQAVGYDQMPIDVVAEAMRNSADIEIALVLDNTGSMTGSMGDLKLAAKDLVAAIYGTATNSSKVKMAVVPYVGAVNIGNGPAQMAWMDTNGDGSWHGHGLEDYSFGYEPGCVYTPSSGGPTYDPGVGIQGWLDDGLTRFASLIGHVLGISSAKAATAADVPDPYGFWPDCWIATPQKLNLFHLFANIPNGAWKGCVMARTEWNDRDVSDEAPDPAEPDTLFVPWFWPDSPDQADFSAAGLGSSPNDYLADRRDLRDATFPKFTDPWLLWLDYNLLKYNGSSGTIDETGPDTLGPNKACPDPILPLTGTRSTIEDKLEGLTHWNGSGTNTAEGISWGMRVLTPGAPFTEGSDEPGTQKVMVVMTDGVNNVDPSDDYSMTSHLSSYGALAHGRVQPATFAGFKEYADQRMQKACEYAKQQNIQIYTVAFNVADEGTLALLRDCATKPPYAYSASTADELVDAFRSIGTSLTELRLTQ